MSGASTDEPIQVTVVGGYLGAGKTTLLNHILRTAEERIAVLVNDFGDINIDADLIDSADGDAISLANGCICCSMVDGFVAALGQIRALDPQPQRLVIEASGVAQPGQITAYAHGPGLALDGTVVVVDGEQIRKQLRNEYIRDVIAQQLRAADLLVINKIDLIDDLQPAAEAIAALCDARQVPAVNGELPLEVLLGIEANTPAIPTPPLVDTNADDLFRTWTESTEEPLDRRQLEERLSSLPATVVRAKGIVRFADAPDEAAIVQVVGRRVAITQAGEWAGGASRLVFVELWSKNP